MFKNILLGSILAFAMMTTTGCYETNSAVKAASPCATAKCGSGKCSKAMKCGTGKCGSKAKESSMKCAAGKCGTGKCGSK